jgi:uncharacterized protein (TIGR00369 family)
MDDTIAMLQAQAKGLFPDLLGVRILEATQERVRACLTVRDDLCTVPGVMHGGAIMAFADTLGGFATALNLPAGAGTTTIESKTNFLAPAAAGSTISAECVALHRGKRTMVWQTRVTAPDGRLLAVITQTQMVLTAQPSPQEAAAALFAGKSVAEQKALLATLEHGGAALYRSFATVETDPAARTALLAAAEREEENARLLERA